VSVFFLVVTSQPKKTPNQGKHQAAGVFSGWAVFFLVGLGVSSGCVGVFFVWQAVRCFFALCRCFFRVDTQLVIRCFFSVATFGESRLRSGASFLHGSLERSMCLLFLGSLYGCCVFVASLRGVSNLKYNASHCAGAVRAHSCQRQRTRGGTSPSGDRCCHTPPPIRARTMERF
jgi:hypothetical protein